MEKQVIYRNRQELQAADLNNTQGWADEALRHVVTDAISAERHFTGLAVSAGSATEITVAAGRLYDGTTGKVYALEDAANHSLFSYLPLANEKWLAISVVGQEEETELEPRDFLVDLQTREVEPQTVAMQSRRTVVVNIAQGLESATPEKPSAPTGYTLLCHVRLSPSGIQELAAADAGELPNLNEIDARLTAAEGWITAAEPRIAHIVSDISGLSAGMAARATMDQTIALALDMAKVKERLEIPDTYVFYGADHYLDETETDDTQVGYAALVDEGVRFPELAAADAELSLFNPLDSGASLSADGFLLPAYTEVTRLAVISRAGDVTINGYQYQTVAVTRRYMARERRRCGVARSKSSGWMWWQSGWYDPLTRIFRRSDESWIPDAAYRTRAARYVRHGREQLSWVDRFDRPYWDLNATEHTVQGAVLAQTFLSAQTGWMTSVDLYFTSVAASGSVDVSIVETDNGLPDLNRVLAKVTVAQSALAAGWTNIPWERPTYIESGKRYAVVVASGAAHRVAYAAGTEYTQGGLVYMQDGAFLAESGRDLCMRLNFARFLSPRAVVQLESLQLAGGIHDLDLLYEGFTPEGCELAFEYQLVGVWYPVREDTVFNLETSPPLLPLRAVFIGTTDVMPGLRLTDSVARMARYDTEFVHYSLERSLASPSANITVRVLLEDFDDMDHTCTVSLVVGGSPVAATSTLTEVVDDRSRWLEANFALGAATSAYTIKIEGTTADPYNVFHVAERYDLAV